MASAGRLLSACASLAAGAAAESPEIRFGVIEPPVVAQRDVTVRALTSNHPIDPTPRPLECSGLAWAAGRLWMTSDRHAHALFSAKVDPGLASIGTPTSERIIRNEKNLIRDAEGLAAKTGSEGSTSLYVVGSLSHRPTGQPDPNRRRWARVMLGPDGRPVPGGVALLDAEPLREAIAGHLDALQVGSYFAWSPEEHANTDRWGNVEGIAWVPTRPGVASDTALLGLRNPLAGGDAILVAVEGLDAAFDATDPRRPRVTDVFRLDLGERGVSDLCWDPVTRGYLIAAGRSGGPKLDGDQTYPPTTLDHAVFWWSGRKEERPRLLLTVADTHVDAVCRVGDGPLIALGSDEGDVSENRVGRQSLLTLVHLIPPEADAAGTGR